MSESSLPSSSKLDEAIAFLVAVHTWLPEGEARNNLAKITEDLEDLRPVIMAVYTMREASESYARARLMEFLVGGMRPDSGDSEDADA